MTQLIEEDNDFYEGDVEFTALMARLDISLNLAVPAAPPPPPPLPPPPRTPPPVPRAQPITPPRTFPAMRPRSYRTTDRGRFYQVSSPTVNGLTAEWSTAGFATQGVPGSHVHTIQPGSPSTPTRGKKAAYVVFCGQQYGVFGTWAETKPLVNGVSNSIFRGYSTLAEAQAAFDYAQERSWVRDSNTPIMAGTLPQPTTSYTSCNPLNGSEIHNDQWYIVYRGITPGVYRSHLECQINTLGVSGSLHECVTGYALARSKFAAARGRHHVDPVPPPSYSTVNRDVFS